jgi:peptidoglycan/LPS O-acetylase OafA/YrhL
VQTRVIYLKGLNGIRAIAALSVVISHTNLSIGKNLYSLANIAVTIFFAISGFLISYLLFQEKDKFNTISITNFYVRRILRIWPLYFFYLFIATSAWWVLNYRINIDSIIVHVFFLQSIIPYITKINTIEWLYPYWSLGVEELFYVFWPFIVCYTRLSAKWLYLIIISFVLIRLFVYLLPINEIINNKIINELLIINRFDCLLIGALGAWFILYQEKSKLIQIIFSRFIQIFVWLIIFIHFINLQIFDILYFFSFIHPKIVTLFLFLHPFISIITVIWILNLGFNPKNIISMENKVMNTLGKISFGIYIYHPICISLVMWVLSYFTISNIVIQQIITHLLVVLLTVFVAYVSYFYVEIKILRLKDKFVMVKSQNQEVEK